MKLGLKIHTKLENLQTWFYKYLIEELSQDKIDNPEKFL
jgi:hypothetical protein